MAVFKSDIRLRAFPILVGLLAGVATLAHAQGGSISGPLLPGFDKDREIAPVPSVDPDFLVPQRSFTYDPTGANVFANALNPVNGAAALGGATGQLDLALRDSTQTGHTSASRLELLGDSDEDSGVSGTAGGLSRQTGYGMSTSNADFDAGDGGEPNSIYRSSWGGGTSSAFQTSASGWGNKAIHVERMGRDTATAGADQDSSPAMSSGFGSASMGSASRTAGMMGTRSSSATSANGLGNAVSTSEFAPASGLGRSSSQIGGVARAGPASQLGNPTMNPSRRTGTDLESTENDRSAGGAGGAGRASATALSAGAPQTFERLMVFSPLSYAGYSFGTTPFTSLPSFGEHSFLQPNIFNTTPLSLTPRPSSEPGRRTIGEGLATSSTKYGMGSNLGAEASRLGARRSRSSRKNPYLSGNGSNSGTLQGSDVSQ